jgi:4-hydroxybenzoate polyprenyltransferase
MVPDRPDKTPDARTMWFHLKTISLFTKGDFKSVVGPQGIFAISVAFSGTMLKSSVTPMATAQMAMRVPLMLFWLWLHLLVEDITNQRLPSSIAEDSINKPWRPLPSGRISTQESQRLLRTLVPLTAIFSNWMGSFAPSVTFMMLVWLYNDLDCANAGPLIRNLTNAAGLACFGWGAVSVLVGLDANVDWEMSLRPWVLLTSMVTMTTIHAQDFPDMPGDRARGRKTVPLVYGEEWARAGLAVMAIVWSILCLSFWCVTSAAVWVTILALGGTMAVATVQRWGQSWDERVWQLWCGWMMLIYFLPCFSTLA